MKKAEGVVKLVVCNPNDNKEQKEKEKTKSQELNDVSSIAVAQKTPQKSGASGEFNDTKFNYIFKFYLKISMHIVLKTIILYDLYLMFDPPLL